VRRLDAAFFLLFLSRYRKENRRKKEEKKVEPPHSETEHELLLLQGSDLMKTWLRIIGSVALLGLLPLAPLEAQTKGVGSWRPVKDDIGFFSPRAREQADQKVGEIKRTFNKDLYIEAISPPPQPKGLDTKDTKAVDAFFDEFAKKRFTDLHENGVYVLIVNNAKVHKLRVMVGDNTAAEHYFTAANRDTLFKNFREKLSANDKDGALLYASNYVFDTMKSNHPVVPRKTAMAPAPVHHEDAPARSTGFNWMPIVTILLVVIGVWVLFAIIRGLMGAGGGGGGMGAPGMGYGGGGGGFFSNFLGGMFGAAAGMWMYNQFFGHSTPSAFGGGPSDGGAASYPDSGPADTSGSVVGGDFGNDDGGGGDWGGDDAGGGDAGGGDAGGGVWGGGGGDWGGGGGDWGGGGGDFGGGGGGGDW
jgi:hypothetical protein